MYIIVLIYRTHSSGSENFGAKCFTTLDEASKFLQGSWYADLIEGWDPEDMRYDYDDYDDEDMLCDPPKKEDFSAAVLESKLGNNGQVTIHDAYSMFCAHVPIEVVLILDK